MRFADRFVGVGQLSLDGGDGDRFVGGQVRIVGDEFVVGKVARDRGGGRGTAPGGGFLWLRVSFWGVK